MTGHESLNLSAVKGAFTENELNMIWFCMLLPYPTHILNFRWQQSPWNQCREATVEAHQRWGLQRWDYKVALQGPSGWYHKEEAVTFLDQHLEFLHLG